MRSPARMSSFQEPPSNRVWKDTSEAEIYGSYLDDNGRYSRAAPGLIGHNSTGAPHADIAVGLNESGGSGAQRAASYTGRKRTWPGSLFLLLITLAALSAISFFGYQTYSDAQLQQELSQDILSSGSRPRKVRPPKICVTPNYVTSGTQIYATNGAQKHLVHITGINWSGMENVEGVPHGLSYKQSSLDDIAEKLAEMNINAVRLPLNAKMIIEDSAVDVKQFVNVIRNPDLKVKTYIDMIKKVVQGLAKQQIVVLLDMHRIDPKNNADTLEQLWYTDAYPMETMILMYRKLAKALCNDLHYNIMGVDIKNEPVGGCWPQKDNEKYCPLTKNWPRAVEKIGNAILEVCPKWLIVVEGLYSRKIIKEVNGQNVTYDDWYGASLQNATLNPIKLSMPNKIVFAPHFYSPSVYPSSPFFASQKAESDGSLSVVEYANNMEGTALLTRAVKAVLDNAWGGLLVENESPVLYGEFGGIYGKSEELPGKTSTRVIDYLIQYADKTGMSGGFVWALNPDGIFHFNSRYSPNKPWQFGLYADSSWQDYHDDFATALRKLKGNGIIPCFLDAPSNATTALPVAAPGLSESVTAPATRTPEMAMEIPTAEVVSAPIVAPEAIPAI